MDMAVGEDTDQETPSVEDIGGREGIDYVKTKESANLISENRLSIDEKKRFDKAKDDAWTPWLALEAVPCSSAFPEERCPLRCLLRWKDGGEKSANARVSMQDFKHCDVLEQKLHTEPLTLLRLGKNAIYKLAFDVQ